eukprot:2164380-Rhodomonas_salina.1
MGEPRRDRFLFLVPTYPSKGTYRYPGTSQHKDPFKRTLGLGSTLNLAPVVFDPDLRLLVDARVNQRFAVCWRSSHLHIAQSRKVSRKMGSAKMTRSNNLSALQLASITVAVLLQCTSSFSFTTTPLLKTRVPRLKLRGDVPAVTSPTASKNGMSMLLNYDQSYSMKSRQKIGRIEVESTHLDFKTQTLITDSTDEQQPHIVSQQQIRDRFPNEQKEKTRQLDQELHDHIGDVDQAFTSAKAIYKELIYGEARDTMTQEEKDAKLMLAMKLMDQVFESDFAQVRNKQYAGVTDLRAVTNVTCMRPKNVDQQVEACLFDDDLLKMDLEEGRVCAGGCCSEAGSRVKLSNVISEAECNEMIRLSDSLMFDNADSFAGQKQNLPLQLSAAAADIDFHLLYL